MNRIAAKKQKLAARRKARKLPNHGGEDNAREAQPPETQEAEASEAETIVLEDG